LPARTHAFYFALLTAARRKSLCAPIDGFSIALKFIYISFIRCCWEKSFHVDAFDLFSITEKFLQNNKINLQLSRTLDWHRNQGIKTITEKKIL